MPRYFKTKGIWLDWVRTGRDPPFSGVYYTLSRGYRSHFEKFIKLG
jgi:hypothetical protein